MRNLYKCAALNLKFYSVFKSNLYAKRPDEDKISEELLHMGIPVKRKSQAENFEATARKDIVNFYDSNVKFMTKTGMTVCRPIPVIARKQIISNGERISHAPCPVVRL